MIIDPWLARAAGRRPDRVALETPAERLTYAELEARARLVAGRLAARGAGPGTRVGLALPAGTGFVEALHGCLVLGAVAMPVDLRLGEGEREAVARAADLVLDTPLDGEPAPIAPARPAAGDPALVVHTSGTTGAPRPVVLSFGNIQANALGSAVALGLDPHERWLCPLPLSHVGGLMVLLRSAIYATTAVLEPPPFDAARVAGLLGTVTIASLVPTMLVRVLAVGVPPPGPLRCILLGGAPGTPALLRKVADAGLPVAQTYGLTQACSQVTVSEPGDAETAGRPLIGVGVAVAPDGEILVSGPTVAGGGTLRTGDLGRLDREGRLIVVGRRADTIVTGGDNVAPAEVEAALLEHPAVAEAAVFGRPDLEWGEAVTAAVVLRPRVAAGPDELRAWCAERVAGYKVPKRVLLVASLPRTASGKLLRRALADAGPS